MAYQDVEKSNIESFEYCVKEGLLDPVVHEIKKPKAQRKYNDYIKKVISANPKEYFINEMPTIEKKDFVELASFIAFDIFGEKNIKEFNDLVNNKLKTNGSNMIFDGISTNIMNLETKEIIRNIEIPDFYHVSSIITLLHEYTHYHMQLRNNTIEKHQHLNEVPSIYVEKIATKILKDSLNIPDLELKIQETRLETIVWHYFTHENEVRQFIDLYTKLKKNPALSLVSGISASDLEKEFQWLKNNKSLHMFNLYRESMASSYGLGYLFSESLLSKYLDDKDTTTKKIRNAIDREIGLPELLDYYKINASNDEVYETVDKTLSKVKNKII